MITISMQIYTLICYTLGFICTPLTIYRVHKYYKHLSMEIYLFLSSLLLTLLGYILDMYLIHYKVLLPDDTSGPLFAILFSLTIIFTLPHLTIRLLNKDLKIKYHIYLSVCIICEVTLLLTQFTIYRYIIRGILVIVLLIIILICNIALLTHLIKNHRSVFTNFSYILLSIYIVLIFGVLLFDLSSKEISIFIFPLYYLFLNLSILHLLERFIKNSKNIEMENNYRKVQKIYNLSERELSIIYELFRGSTYKSCAENLNISINTVRTHVSNIYKKCGIKNKIELINLIKK